MTSNRRGGFRPAPLGVVRSGLVAVIALVVPVASPARTWIIQHDPGVEKDQIGAVVQQAASGDSVVIGPGTYYEHISTDDKTLTFVGADGAFATVLDGGVPIPGRQGSIIYSSQHQAGSLVLRGLTFQHGQGSTWDGFNLGGAINWTYDLDRPFPDVDISDCVFTDNTPFQFGTGSVLNANTVDRLQIRSCTFSDNCCAGENEGMVNGEAADAEVIDCEFDLVTEGSCALNLTGDNAHIDGCAFRANAAYTSPSLWLVDELNATVEHNQFIDSGPAAAATAIGFTYTGIPDPPFPYQSISIHDNLLWNSTYQGTGASPTVQLICPNQGIDVERNTFVGCGLFSDGGGTPAVIQNNIFYKSMVQLYDGAGGQVQCDDAWPTAMGPFGQGYTLQNNIAADPQFCGPTDGDLQIAATSPCANGNSPAGCGQIGEFGVGCGDTRVQTLTWGRVKLHFH